MQKQAACTSVNISHPSSVLTRVTTATRNQEGFQWSDYTVSRHTPTRVVTHADTRSVRSPPLCIRLFVARRGGKDDCSHISWLQPLCLSWRCKRGEGGRAGEAARPLSNQVVSCVKSPQTRAAGRSASYLAVTSKPWKSTCEQPVIKARRQAQQSGLESQPITSETR